MPYTAYHGTKEYDWHKFTCFSFIVDHIKNTFIFYLCNVKVDLFTCIYTTSPFVQILNIKD